MAGDLWEEALNEHPSGLAELKGQRWRLSRQRKDARPINESTLPQAELKKVPLNSLIRHQFDLKEKMGTVLRESHRFDQLGGIREAYGLAFFKDHSGICDALSDQSLDALSTVRNVIIHRSGVSDDDYVTRSSYLPIPKTPVGQEILLDGEIVVGLMNPVLLSAIKLLEAVDAWIAAN
jgi:hypothetical protein